jgi:hypothetical protein
MFEVTPEGSHVNYLPLHGRTHTNGYFDFSQDSPGPVGWTTQVAPPLPGGPSPLVDWSIFHCLHDAASFDFSSLVAHLRVDCGTQHHWAAIEGALALTTLLRFDGPVYHAAQYAESQIVDGDTTWTVPWSTRALPQPPGEAPVIWIEGVGRIKGVVEGRVTVLCSDSLFVMGDLITADTDISSCGNEELFGTVPAGSPNRIGLVGEKDVIIAATLENGFSNGANGGPTCGMASSPVVTTCAQGRQDVIVTAAILALGCSFEVEFWKTTAWRANIPPVSPQNICWGGWNNTEVTVWDTIPGGEHPDCQGADGLFDRRGTLWFCGALCAYQRGFTVRYGDTPWGDNVMIGYTAKVWRPDPNLAADPPPYWPDLRWISPVALDVELVTSPATSCGSVVETGLFLADWSAGLVGLQVEVPPGSWEDSLAARVVLVRGGLEQTLEEAHLPIAHPGASWVPTIDLAPWLDQPASLRLELWRTDILWMWPDILVDDGRRRPVWNTDGAQCTWQLDALPVASSSAATAFTLSDPRPNPFNPSTRVELGLPAPETVRLEVYDVAGRRVALTHDGPLPAGSHAFTIDGAGWAAGLYLLVLRQGNELDVRKLLLVK